MPRRGKRRIRQSSAKKPKQLPEWASAVPDALDRRESAEIAVPTEERVVAHCVWGVEFYGPGTVDRLVDGIDRLGIEGDRPHRRLAEAVASTRSSDLGVSHAQLSAIVREPRSTVADLFNPPVAGELPVGVERIACEWMSVTPSLSAIVARFDLTHHAALGAHRALAAYAPGRTWPDEHGGVHHEPPVEQQRRRFREALESHADLASDWLAEKLPGEFALGGLRCPATALVTARLFDPFLREQADGPMPWSYRYAANLENHPTMRNTRNAAVACSPMLSPGLRTSRMMLFGGKADEVAAGWNRKDDESAVADDAQMHRVTVAGAGRRLPGPTVTFAVTELLGDLLADLARARDQPLSRRGTRRRRRQLADELEASGRIVDAAHLAEDLTDGIFPLIFADYDGSDYVERHEQHPDRDSSLREDLDYRVRERAKLVLRREQRLRDALSIRADLHAAIAGIEAVRWAAATIVVALVTIAVTLLVS